MRMRYTLDHVWPGFNHVLATGPAPVRSTIAIMSSHAAGTFEVAMNPQPPYDTTDGTQLGRVSITKTFKGDLDATSTVEMLSAMTSVKGSAGYVAIERVVGTLDGRQGSFVLQHSGTMRRGTPELSVTVVPDSGAGELVGLAGRLTIEVVDRQHRYALDYTLEPSV
jgi:hypothetical protein